MDSTTRKTEAHSQTPTGRRATRDERATTDGYARLTPDVDGTWVEEFVVEQRLLGVPGSRIGDALATVQSHVAESGEGAHDAFGDPRAYARDLATSGAVVGRPGTGWILGNVLGLVGLLLTSTGADSWLFGEGSLQVTAGLLVATVLAAASCLALVAAAEPVLRLVVDRPWPAVGAVALWTVVVAGVMLVLSAPVAHVPASAVTVVGVVLLVVSTGLEWRAQARGELADPIVGPGEPAQKASGDRLGWLTVFLFPVFAVLLLGLSWALNRFA